MTAEEIIAYMEAEIADAYETHEELRGKDARRSLAYLIKAHTLEQLLDEIKSK